MNTTYGTHSFKHIGFIISEVDLISSKFSEKKYRRILLYRLIYTSFSHFVTFKVESGNCQRFESSSVSGAQK